MTDTDTPPPADDGPQGPDGPPPAYSTPPPTQPRPLLRRDTDKHIAGVAGGLADYLNVDATVLRVGFIVLALFGGFGILLYVLGWVAMPSPSAPRPHLEQWFADTPNPVALVVIGIAALVLFGGLGVGPGDHGIGLGLLLLFGGWLLFRADNRGSAAPVAPGVPASPPTPPASSSTWYGPGGAAQTAPLPPAVPPWVAPERRPRSMLGRLTIGVGLAVVGVAAMFERLGVVDLAPVQYAALALTITGLGLLVGAWFGRAYGLILLGLLLVPLTLVLSLAPVSIPSGAGELSLRPDDLTELDPTYRLGAGELDLDLTAVDFTGADAVVTISVGAGQTTVVLPDDVNVRVDARMRAGAMDLFGVRTVGRPFLDPVVRTDEGVAGTGRLELHFDNGVGEIVVRRAEKEL